MKIFFVIAAMCSAALGSAVVAHAKSSVVTAAVTLQNANGGAECGGSTYGLILDGYFFDSVGHKQTVHGCVESVVIPLDASDCLRPKRSLDLLKAANATLGNATKATNVDANLLIEDGGFTVLNLTATCN